jgi:hypothetical protein
LLRGGTCLAPARTMKIIAVRVCTIAALLSACTSKGKAEITEKAFEHPETRREMLEATLRVLDSHPDYVDELFELSLKHPATLDRLFTDTSQRMGTDEKLATRQAERLTAHPRGMNRVMVKTMDMLHDRPLAQQALVDAMEERASIAAAVLVDRPDQLATVFRAIMVDVIKSPDTLTRIKKILKELI